MSEDPATGAEESASEGVGSLAAPEARLAAAFGRADLHGRDDAPAGRRTADLTGERSGLAFFPAAEQAAKEAAEQTLANPGAREPDRRVAQLALARLEAKAEARAAGRPEAEAVEAAAAVQRKMLAGWETDE